MPLPDVLLRRQSSFLLWRSASSLKAPLLIIGEFAAGNPNTLANRKDIPLVGAGPTSPGLWALAASDSGLADGIYHRSEEHTSELQSLRHLVCRLLLEKKKILLLNHSGLVT